MKLLGVRIQPTEGDDSLPWIYWPSLPKDFVDVKGLLWFPCTITFFPPNQLQKRSETPKRWDFYNILNFRVKITHNRSIITNTASVPTALSCVQATSTKQWWKAGATAEQDIRKWDSRALHGTNEVHLWSFPFFSFFQYFYLTVIFLLIYLNQFLLISRPEPIP